MSSRDGTFRGRNIVITGGSSGIGRELAGRFADQGASLLIIARDERKLQACERELSSRLRYDATVHTFGCDVTDHAAVMETFDAIVAEGGVPDILINSAGILAEGYFQEQGVDVFRRIMDTNFFGTLHCIKAVVPLFERRGAGWIVNLGSLAGLVGAFGYSAYGASKHAVVGLSAVLRLELKPRGIRVQVVCPPEFDSPMVDDLNTYRTRENRVHTHLAGVMSLPAVADDILRGMARGDHLIVPGRLSRVVATISRLAPDLADLVADAQVARVYRGPDRP